MPPASVSPSPPPGGRPGAFSAAQPRERAQCGPALSPAGAREAEDMVQTGIWGVPIALRPAQHWWPGPPVQEPARAPRLPGQLDSHPWPGCSFGPRNDTSCVDPGGDRWPRTGDGQAQGALLEAPLSSARRVIEPEAQPRPLVTQAPSAAGASGWRPCPHPRCLSAEPCPLQPQSRGCPRPTSRTCCATRASPPRLTGRGPGPLRR